MVGERFQDLDGIVADSAAEAGFVETPVGVFLGWLDVTWPSPSQPGWRLRGIEHFPDFDSFDLERELKKARTRRRRALRRCRLCGERHLPGHMSSAQVCQGCAERRLGVVH